MNEKLANLEKEGKYVFHGSPDGNINLLIPKQGTHIPDLSKPAETIFDGNPAVSATPYVDFAVFRAIINHRNIPMKFHSGFGFRDGKKEFRISSREVFELSKGKSGFIYVFNKVDFEPYSRDGIANEKNMEWRSYKEIKPIEVIKVTSDDLVSKEFIDFLD